MDLGTAGRKTTKEQRLAKLREERYARAARLLKAWQTRLKKAKRKVAKLERTMRYYEGVR